MTYEEAHRLFSYDPETGIVTRKIDAGRAKAGDVVGCLGNHGYLMVKRQGKCYLLHRVIWLMTHGQWPNVTDHINRNRLDNRIENLRSVKNSENILNSERSDNARFCRFRKDCQKWEAQVTRGGYKHLGYHDTEAQATAAAKDYIAQLEQVAS